MVSRSRKRPSVEPRGRASMRWLFARQAELFHLRQILRHARIFLLGEFAEIGPGVEAGVMTVVEADTHRVATDRLGADDADLALLRGRRRLFGAMALGFGAGAFDAQQFVGDRA